MNHSVPSWTMIAVVLMAGCASEGSSPPPQRCVRIWNDSVPYDLSTDFDRAIVYLWTDKADDDGCGVTFVSEDGEPWAIVSGVVVDEDVDHWTRVDGDQWGEDSPEGDAPTEPNVVVLEGGSLSAL
jgi:hypothetical protein